MKSLFKYILKGRKNNPPLKVLEAFKLHFGNSLNVDWEKMKNEFEAIFYYQNIEQIARFSSSGELISIKRNLTLQNLTDDVADIASSFGEVMNVIEICANGVTNFEIIYRDKDLIRYSLLLDEKGNVQSHNVL